MAKIAKIDDIKRPDKVTPTSTARPIIITNRPTLTADPMMAPADGDERPSETGSITTHTAKTIQPLSAIADEASTKSEVTDESKPGDAAPKADDEAADEAEQTQGDEAVVSESKPDLSSRLPVQPKGDVDTRDPEAAITAEEAAAAEARAKREQEVEDIIASRKYAVPINAVQRRRSRANTILLFVTAVLLAAVLADLIVDVGIVRLPTTVPHTHFFSN